MPDVSNTITTQFNSRAPAASHEVSGTPPEMDLSCRYAFGDPK